MQAKYPSGSALSPVDTVCVSTSLKMSYTHRQTLEQVTTNKRLLAFYRKAV